jgi:hypothetical protein
MEKKQRTERHYYSLEEKEFLKKIAKGRSYSEISTLFNERFGLELSRCQIWHLKFKMGLTNGEVINPVTHKPCHRYSLEETEFLKSKFGKHSYTEIINLFTERFGFALTYYQIVSKGKRSGIHKLHRKKGKIGEIKPIGSQSKLSGYSIIKIAEMTNYKKNWKYKHHVIWENAHGPIPDGQVITFVDGNRSNFDINNLLMVSRAERVMMNTLGINSAGPELFEAGLQVARLKLLINKRERELKEKGVTV